MTVSFSSDPIRVLVKRQARLQFHATLGNFVRVWCTDAPPGSKLRRQLDETGASRVAFYSGQSEQPFTADFDVGGVYGFTVDEISSGSAHGGVYDTDPAKAPSETIIGSPTTLTIEVGSKLGLQLGTGTDTAQLMLYVWGDAVQATDIEHHGELTPAIVDPKTTKARAASESSTVRTALAALTSYSPTSMIGDVAGVIDALINAFNAHRVSTAFHANADSDHNVPTEFRHATGTRGAREALSRFAREFGAHVTNDKNDQTSEPPLVGPGTALYHVDVDWLGYPHVIGASDLVGAHVQLADLWRRYEAHRLSTAAHTTPDTVNAAAPLSPLLALHSAFLAQVLDLSPAAPANEHDAVQLLTSGGGFKESHA